jgi:hypothetical protein
LDKTGGFAVDADLRGPRLGLDDKDRQRGMLVRSTTSTPQPGGPGRPEAGRVDSCRADVVEVCLPDAHAAELGVQHGAQHSDVLQLRRLKSLRFPGGAQAHWTR